MDWECPDCGRRYDDPPERCVCGGQVVPAGTSSSSDRDVVSRAAENLYNVFFDPSAAKHGLLEAGPRVRFAFRLIVAISVLLVLTVVVGSLL